MKNAAGGVVAGASVSVLPLNNAQMDRAAYAPRETTTDASGRYSFEGLEPDLGAILLTRTSGFPTKIDLALVAATHAPPVVLGG